MGVAPVSLRSAMANCYNTKLEPSDAIVMAHLFITLTVDRAIQQMQSGEVFNPHNRLKKKGEKNIKNPEIQEKTMME